MYLDLYEAAVLLGRSVPEGLDKALRGLTGGQTTGLPKCDVEKAEKSLGARTGLIECKAGFGAMSWAAAVGAAKHGGRTTLEYQK